MPSQSIRKRSREAREEEEEAATAATEMAPSTRPRHNKKRRTLTPTDIIEVGSSDPSASFAKPRPAVLDVLDVDEDSRGEITTPTLVEDSPVEEETAEKRRRAKGKGKAVEVEEGSPMAAPSSAPTMDAEVKVTLGRQVLLGRLGRTFTCGICISLFDNPSSLACGHVFCRGCLEQCFKRERADAEEGPGDIRDQALAYQDATLPSSSRQPVPPLPRPARPMSADQRRRNLRCPVCRAKVREPPFSVFPLRDAADLLRAAEAEGLLPMEADSPSIAPTNSKKRKAEEADATWGGLFPEVQGEKAKKQRRVHTHGVDDVDDGVFRCWRCNWEIEDGQCEHCGEIYDVASDDGSNTSEQSHFSNLSPLPGPLPGESDDEEDDDSDAEVQLFADVMRPSGRRGIAAARLDRPLGRQSHNVFESEGEEDGTGFFDDDEPNSDDRAFLADSDDEAPSSPPRRRRERSTQRRRASTSDDEVQASMSGRVIDLDGEEEEGTSEDEPVAPPTRRRGPLAPISIDDDEDEEDEESDELEEVEAPAPRRRGATRRRTPSPEPSEEGSSDEGEEEEEPVPPPPRRPRLVIQESDSEEDDA